ncbi:MAG: hypothetical protein WC279_02200 [Sulfurimonas sp.]|uniref:beta strand repeat-containing protein n=1 Tax=Sulfurimonas sp. TaxID=2022749 RepID=UPI00356937EE
MTTGTETVTGTANNDTINGVISALSSAKTFDATDIIDGAAGTDTLNISINSAHTGMTGTGAVANVETIALTNGGTVSRNFDATGVTGATKYVIDATTGLVTLSDLDSTPEVSLSNYTSTGAFSTAFATGTAELTGTTDAMTFTISGLGTSDNASTTANEQKVVTATLNDIETVNVNATGNNVVAFGGTDMTTLNIAGSGDVNVTAVATSTTSVDAASSTGDITLNATAITAAATLTSVSTGSGNDSVTVDEVDGTANMTLNGGAGADTLTLNSNGGTVQYAMTGFETLALGTIGTAGLTMSGTNTEDLTTVSTNVNVAQAVSLVNMGAGDLTVNSKGATVNAGSIAAAHTGATTLNYTADAASVTAKTVQAPLADFTLSGTSDVTVNVGAYIDNSGSDITAAAATSVTVNVASGKDSAATPAELTIFGSTLTAAEATSVTVVADGKIGVTGDYAQVVAAKATSASITSNSKNGVFLDIDAALVETLTIDSNGATTLTGSTLSGVQVANITVDDGAYTGVALADLSSLTIAGSGVTSTTAGTTASSANTGALGGDNAYALTVNASGLKGGLVTGAINTGAGYDITVDASDVTGLVTLGTIGATTTGNNVTVTTVGTDGAVDLDTVAATGAVTITNSSASTFDVGNVTGASVSIDTSNTTGNKTIAAVTSTGALTLTNTGTGTYTQTGAISAGITGDVTINLDGTLGAVSLGTIAGKNVNVDVSNTVGTVTALGAITAHTSATIALSALQANAATIAPITHSSTGTSLAVAVTGGVLADDIEINDGAATTSITVTGDLAAGTDTIDVNSTNTTSTTMSISLAGITSYATATIDVAGAAAAGTTQTITGGAGADTITFGTTDTLTAADTVTGGAAPTGTVDTLVITDTQDSDAIFTNVTGIEKLTLAAASTVTLGAQAQEAGIATVVAVTVGDAYVIDASAMTTAVTYTMTALTTGTSTITAGSGDDTLALGGGVDTVIFAATAAANGEDTITAFTAAEDILDFDAFLGTVGVLDGNTGSAGDSHAVTAGGTVDSGIATGIDVNIADKIIVLDSDDWASGDFAAAIEAVSGTVKFGLADGAKAVILLGDVADEAQDFEVYYVVGTNGTTANSETITLVGTVSVNDGDAITGADLGL